MTGTGVVQEILFRIFPSKLIDAHSLSKALFVSANHFFQFDILFRKKCSFTTSH